MKSETNRRAFSRRPYGMKKHHATRLHYDLRLEWNGVLLSWAILWEPSCRAGATCEAIEMDDHRTENLSFEGLHPTGPIMLWDSGAWEPHPESDDDDIESSLCRGILRFTLHGEKLKGGWTLTRTNDTRNGSRPIWTFRKDADSFATSHDDQRISEAWQRSVRTNMTMEEIVRNWTNPRDRHERQGKLFG
jgi:bifunctional non-homologous end joining protein LigD